MKKIYFAGAIRGGREYVTTYEELIQYMKKLAHVLTEHISDKTISALGEDELTDAQIYTRDLNWIASCDALIAEVSMPSLGVGYEVGVAEALGKPILCLYRRDNDFKLSAMISGNPKIKVKRYEDIVAAKSAINEFISGLDFQGHAVEETS